MRPNNKMTITRRDFFRSFATLVGALAVWPHLCALKIRKGWTSKRVAQRNDDHDYSYFIGRDYPEVLCDNPPRDGDIWIRVKGTDPFGESEGVYEMRHGQWELVPTHFLAE